MDETPRFYVTTPIYYVNDRPHLGHVYTTMVADVVARYHRLRGDNTFFLTGVDEHAAKVSDVAAEKGLSAQAWADQNAEAFRDLFNRLGITNSDFVRTSAIRHKERVSQYVRALLDSGDVYKGEYEGWYDAGQEEYVSEGSAKGNGYRSAINGRPLVRRTETNYFFKLSSYREPLLSLYDNCDRAGKPFVQPDARKNEAINRIREMDDIPISRTGSPGWGIPVPGDCDHTIYVWVDALFNYLTHTDTQPTDSAPNGRREYWQAGAVHFIAKDILWFHAAVWPALLLALQKCRGYEWVTLPKQVYVHSFWLGESGQKMSKSLGNSVGIETIWRLVEDYGLDALRYFLATQGPIGVSDSVFSEESVAEVYNSDLANTFGNSCSRVSNMIDKYFDGELPYCRSENDQIPRHFEVANWLSNYRAHFESLALASAANTALQAIREVDAYIEQKQPFRMIKDNSQKDAAGQVLHECAEALRVASLLLWPYIPDTCETHWRRIGCKHYAEQLANNGLGNLEQWSTTDHLLPGSRIERGSALFPRH